MNRGFNLKYDQMKENDPTTSQPDGDTIDQSIILYEPDEQARNICFVIDNTRWVFLNYSYLISGEYLPDENKIILAFTTHEVTMEGIKLEKLYYQIMDHEVKQLVAKDSRYNGLINDSSVVNKVRLEKISE
ncbi:MAG: hypothetical protein NTW29_01655 [Bacteroidetes bacterium]|nr:hypothetical protein [Bacteroidota bacterium]